MKEHSKQQVELLPQEGVFYPKSYFKRRKLFSSQIGAVNQESILRAIDSGNRRAILMQDSETGDVIVFDGHHSVAFCILEGTGLPYELISFDSNIRKTPFSVFYTNFKRLLSRGVSDY